MSLILRSSSVLRWSWLMLLLVIGCATKELGPVDRVERSTSDGIKVIGSALDDREVSAIKAAINKFAAAESGMKSEMSNALLSIQHTGPDDVEARIGKFDGPAKGKGRDLRLKREHGSWKVSDTSTWRE